MAPLTWDQDEQPDFGPLAEELLAAGDPEALISDVMDCVTEIEPRRRDKREALEAVNDLVRYYRANATRMKYRLYRESGLPIGSTAKPANRRKRSCDLVRWS